MDNITADEAIKYAISSEFLKLYSGFLLAWIVYEVGESITGIFPRQVEVLNILLLILFNIFVFLTVTITIISIFYKIFSDI